MNLNTIFVGPLLLLSMGDGCFGQNAVGKADSAGKEGAMMRVSVFWMLFFLSSSHALEGTVLQRGFRGPITGDTVLYNIYLPEGYDSSLTRYPSIYHLHGIGGSQGGAQNNDVPAAFEAALGRGIIGPVIVVFPNGRNNSFWADSKDGTVRVETNVIRELIPHVDSSFRTLAVREQRVIQGFSMGGFGAAEYAGKFPDRFRVCVVYDGALLAWSNVQTVHPGIASAMFGDDGAYFNRYSPWSNWAANFTILRTGMPIRMAVGALTAYNQAFRDSLLAWGAVPEYVETGTPHALPPILALEGENNIRFIARYLGTPVPIATGKTGRWGRGSIGPFLNGPSRHVDVRGRTASNGALK